MSNTPQHVYSGHWYVFMRIAGRLSVNLVLTAFSIFCLVPFLLVISTSITTEEAWQSAASRVSVGRIADADEIVGTALYLASDASSYMNGKMVVLDGGGS